MTSEEFAAVVTLEKLSTMLDAAYAILGDDDDTRLRDLWIAQIQDRIEKYDAIIHSMMPKMEAG